MKSKDKKDIPATKAEPLTDADLDKASGGFFDTGFGHESLKDEKPLSGIASSAQPNGGKTTTTR